MEARERGARGCDMPDSLEMWRWMEVLYCRGVAAKREIANDNNTYRLAHQTHSVRKRLQR